MEKETTRERLLRLNKEIHSKHFEYIDHKPLLDLWDEAEFEYNRDNLGRAQEIIDEAYRILYSSQPDDARKQAPPQKATQRQAAQKTRQPPTTQYAQGKSDKPLAHLMNIFTPCYWILRKPSGTFLYFVSKYNPGIESIEVALIFGGIAAIIFREMVEEYRHLIAVPIALLAWIFLLSFILQRLTSAFGGSIGFKMMQPVIVYSATPSLIATVIILVMTFTASGASTYTLDLITTVVFGLSLIWSSALLYKGMRVCGKLDSSHAAITTIIALLATATAIAAVMLQGYLTEYLPQDPPALP